MSRHNRQRNKRWAATKASADPEKLERGMDIWRAHGKLSKQLSPLERRLVVDLIRNEYRSAMARGVSFYDELAYRWNLPRKAAKTKALSTIYRGIDLGSEPGYTVLTPAGYSYGEKAKNHPAMSGKWVKLS